MPTEPKNNFDVLIRILDNRGPDGTVMSGPEDDDVSSVLTDQVSQQINQGGRKGGEGPRRPTSMEQISVKGRFSTDIRNSLAKVFCLPSI